MKTINKQGKYLFLIQGTNIKYNPMKYKGKKVCQETLTMIKIKFVQRKIKVPITILKKDIKCLK